MRTVARSPASPHPAIRQPGRAAAFVHGAIKPAGHNPRAGRVTAGTLRLRWLVSALRGIVITGVPGQFSRRPR